MKTRDASEPFYSHERCRHMPAALGHRLTTAREARGLSIADAAHETRISARWLRLLEQGDLAAFGSVTYARSFVRAYSAFLEVDAAEFLKALPEKGVLGGSRDYRYLTESHGPWLREREPGRELRAPQHGGLRRRAQALRDAPQKPALQHIQSPIPAGLGVFALMLITTAMWGMHLASGTDAGAGTSPDTVAQRILPQPSFVVPVAAVSKPAVKAAAPAEVRTTPVPAARPTRRAISMMTPTQLPEWPAMQQLRW